MDKLTEYQNKLKSWVGGGPNRGFTVSVGVRREPPEYVPEPNGIYTLTLQEGKKTVLEISADSTEKMMDLFITTQQELR